MLLTEGQPSSQKSLQPNIARKQITAMPVRHSLFKGIDRSSIDVESSCCSDPGHSTIASILLARVGWMTFYNGPQKGDARVIGGGKYVKTKLGHEAFNFRLIKGRVYAHVQPQMQS